jgi:hypothetical protein
MLKVLRVATCIPIVLLYACVSPEPTPEQLQRAEALREAEQKKQAAQEKRQQCLEESFEEQRQVLMQAGYNVRHRRSGEELTWSTGAAPQIPSKARHYLRKMEHGVPPVWFTAQIYINPTGYLIIEPGPGGSRTQSETSSRGRVAFQVYALTPSGYAGQPGNDTRFGKKDFAVSFRDVFHQPGTTDYLLAVMPATDKLPKRIGEILEECGSFSR